MKRAVEKRSKPAAAAAQTASQRPRSDSPTEPENPGSAGDLSRLNAAQSPVSADKPLNLLVGPSGSDTMSACATVTRFLQGLLSSTELDEGDQEAMAWILWGVTEALSFEVKRDLEARHGSR